MMGIVWCVVHVGARILGMTAPEAEGLGLCQAQVQVASLWAIVSSSWMTIRHLAMLLVARLHQAMLV